MPAMNLQPISPIVFECSPSWLDKFKSTRELFKISASNRIYAPYLPISFDERSNFTSLLDFLRKLANTSQP